MTIRQDERHACYKPGAPPLNRASWILSMCEACNKGRLVLACGASSSVSSHPVSLYPFFQGTILIIMTKRKLGPKSSHMEKSPYPCYWVLDLFRSTFGHPWEFRHKSTHDWVIILLSLGRAPPKGSSQGDLKTFRWNPQSLESGWKTHVSLDQGIILWVWGSWWVLWNTSVLCNHVPLRLG